ncbi:unnamed protein product [Schistocephalus solidus]|uniref:DUF1084 domain-containing protein n=1 Tax=Schistocephalus solidus TaxID=70667 RepID=A0A183T5X9_SCHSO|nr:unnamed protein product [Schistocephalus solidus]
MSLSPVARLKLDELFVRWLTDDGTQRYLRQSLSFLKTGDTASAKKAINHICVAGPAVASFSSSHQKNNDCNFETRYPPLETNNRPNSSLGFVPTAPRPNTPPCLPLQHAGKLLSPRSPRRSTTSPVLSHTSVKFKREREADGAVADMDRAFVSALQIIVYWAIVAGHAASGYSLLVGIPLLPLLVLQIALIYHVWSTLTKRLTHSTADANLDATSVTPVSQL